jgi:hypothetical protein
MAVFNRVLLIRENGCDEAYFFAEFSVGENDMIFTRDMKCFAGRQICRGSSVREGFSRARGIREETRGEEGSRRKELVAVLGRPDSTSFINEEFLF